MAPSSSDFSMELSTSLDTTGETVTTDLTVTYLGSLPSVIVYVYAAVTEHSGAENYDDVTNLTMFGALGYLTVITTVSNNWFCLRIILPNFLGISQ